MLVTFAEPEETPQALVRIADEEVRFPDVRRAGHEAQQQMRARRCDASLDERARARVEGFSRQVHLRFEHVAVDDEIGQLRADRRRARPELSPGWSRGHEADRGEPQERLDGETMSHGGASWVGEQE